MPKEPTIEEFEAKDIALALKGDLGARLRVETVIPYFRIMQDLTQSLNKSGLGGDKEIEHGVNSFKEMHHAIAHQIVILVHALSGSSFLSQIETLSHVMQKLGDLAAETLTKKALIDEIEKAQKGNKP